MQQTGFWANVSLVVASLILLLAWGQLPLFSTQQADVIDLLYNAEDGTNRPSTMALTGATVLTHLNRLDTANTVNDSLFQAAWVLMALAGIGGLVCGGVSLWWPAWTSHAAFAGVVCGVISLVCLGFLRFQYANMTITSLFDSTAFGWWLLLGTGSVLVGQGAGRLGPKTVVSVPQPPPFSDKSPEEIFGSIPTDLSSVPAARRLYLVHLGTNQRYDLDVSKPVSIGRARDNDIVLTDDKVSRHHAVIRWQNGWITIINQSQRAPLHLNQLPILGENALLLGDTITLGQTHLRLGGE